MHWSLAMHHPKGKNHNAVLKNTLYTCNLYILIYTLTSNIPTTNMCLQPTLSRFNDINNICCIAKNFLTLIPV